VSRVFRLSAVYVCSRPWRIPAVHHSRIKNHMELRLDRGESWRRCYVAVTARSVEGPIFWLSCGTALSVAARLFVL